MGIDYVYIYTYIYIYIMATVGQFAMEHDGL